MIDTQNQNMPEGKRKRLYWIIGCGSAAILGLCLILFFVLGGISWVTNFFPSGPQEFDVEVNLSSQTASVGDTFSIEIIIENSGSRNITITSIELPGDLLELAELTDIESNTEIIIDDTDPTIYSLDMLIAPKGQQTITFFFEALKVGYVTDDVNILANETTKPVNISMNISPELTIIDTPEPTPLPIRGDVIPYQSVVQIIAMVEMEDEQKAGWSGSGTIISEDGLILTNAHVVLSDRYYNVVDLLVSMTLEQDQPPAPMFYADVIQADANLDLAVIKIRTDLEGNPPNFDEVDLSPVPVGDSQSLQLGDELVIIGYPGIGGETITLTRGEVSGFTAQETYGNRAYIKTSATIAGGNSGGLAATPQGEIIGIPTKVGYGTAELDYVDCRPLADTNRDGILDENDNCVPTGGFINALRPIDLAMPLIEAAKAGEVAIIEKTPPPQQEEYNPEGDIILEETFTDNSNNWYLEEYVEGNVTISEGQLLMDIYAENTYIFSEIQDIDYESVILVTNVNILNPVNDGDFGFICGYQDNNNFTALEISEDGYFTIWTLVDNEFVTLESWTESDIIPKTGSFLLSAYCGPDRLALAVNETFLVESSNPDYRSGNVGLIAGTYENPNFSIGFDDFILLRP